MSNQPSDIKVAVDAIVFGYSRTEGVSILLIQRKYPPFKNSWAIPGGFVLTDESLEEAIRRELQEETGIEVNYPIAGVFCAGATECTCRYTPLMVKCDHN